MILNFLKGFSVDGKRKQTNFEDKIKKGVKLHTIRKDQHNRWKKGMKIHFSTGSRSRFYNCFKEKECVSVQEIRIVGKGAVFVDKRFLEPDEVEWLAINDGFDTVEDFWGWFDQYTPFTGKIIHWSNIRY